MAWAAVAGAGVSLVGGAIAGNQSKVAADRAARQAAPYGVNGPFGSVSYGPNHVANYSLNGPGQQFADLAQQTGRDALGNYSSNPLGALTPDINSAYGTAFGQMGTGAANSSSNAGSLFKMLQGLGNDPTAIGNNYYQLLSKQAQPGQDMAFDSLQNKLFAQGRLGTSGGGTEVKGFYDSANQADIGRQIAGAQFGQQWQDQLQRQFSGANTDASNMAASRYNLATNLLNTGMNANAGYLNQAGGAQDLYGNIFKPLMNAQANSNGGNPEGGKFQNVAANNSIDAYSNAFGQLSSAGLDWAKKKWGSGGGGAAAIGDTSNYGG